MMPATANERLADLAIRNQVNVQRFTEGQLNQIRKLLREAEIDLTRQLYSAGTEIGQYRLRDMLTAVTKFSQEIESQLYGHSQAQLSDFARQQAGVASVELEETLERLTEISRKAKAAGLGINLTTPDFNLIAKAAVTKPIHGKLLREWWQEWGTGVRAAVSQQVRLGIVENESIDQIVRRIVGTKARNYADGILVVKRRHAEALVRTSVNHVATQAKNDVYAANDDVVEAVQWNSTLDGRTTPICQSRDGKMAAIGNRPQSDIPSGNRLVPPSARPPAHIGCRSTILPVITDWESLGLKNPPASTRASLNGQVPDQQNYNDWLKKQPDDFIESVLGPTKAALFKKGGLTLDRFVDRAGNAYSLSDLKRMNPKAWKVAFARQGGMKKPAPAPRPAPAAAPPPAAARPKGKTEFGGLMEATTPGPAFNTGRVMQVMNNARNINTPEAAGAWVRERALAAKTPWEYGAILDRNNRLLDARRGSENHISYRGLPKFRDELKGGKYFHSHPGSAALSGADMSFAIEYEMQAMTAVGVEFENYYLATGFKKAKLSPSVFASNVRRTHDSIFDALRESPAHKAVGQKLQAISELYRQGGHFATYAEYTSAFNAELALSGPLHIATSILSNQLTAKYGGFTFRYTLQAGAHATEVERLMKEMIESGWLASVEAANMNWLKILKGHWDG